jgi:pimeloyl-ACP methyl ester carboxylesterase
MTTTYTERSTTVEGPAPTPAPHPTQDGIAPTRRIGLIVTLTVAAGLGAAIFAVVGPFAGAQEHVITGSILLSFAMSWAFLAIATTRWTDQPQTWAKVPAAVMAAAGATILITRPTGNEAGWLWPPAILALVGWMTTRARRDLRSRSRVFVLYPVFAALALAAVGGAYETYKESTDPTAADMPGRLVDVGGHKLHINCQGSGSPTVVLEGGLGALSTSMASWIAPNVAPTTRVCVYDRAGRGWSESAAGPQDGTSVATDLHTLLRNAGEPGPYVLAGHSAGGIYVLNFVRLFPTDVAGIALIDSMHPEQYERMASWPGFYEMYRRGSALFPTLARLGVGRLVYGSQDSGLPSPQREQEPALVATPRHNRSVRDEFSQIRTAMNQAVELRDIGETPLMVVTATEGTDPDWHAMQEDLTSLSTNAIQRLVPNATHAMLVANSDAARHTSHAILDVVAAARTHTPIAADA